MAAVLGRTEVGIKEIGSTVTVPSNPKAKLMYYLNCMCAVLDLSNESNLSRLRAYSSYDSLTEEETDALIALCFLLSPTELIGKVIFPDAEMCGTSSNKFYEISAIRKNLLVSESIIIGGQQRHVTKIMAFKESWMTQNWIEPMQHFTERLARIATGQPIRYEAPSTQSYTRTSSNSCDDCCCVIL
ncbi:hypothetical protein ACF0H5_017138 [Mactra antiquata]